MHSSVNIPNPSVEQLAIADWFRTSKVTLPPAAPGKRKRVVVAKNLVVNALAGTGKTTTIVWAVQFARETSILMTAFNKRIAVELTNRLRLSNPHAQAMTLHGLGFGLVRRYWEGVRVCDRNERALALTERVCGGSAPDAMKKLVTKLHTKGREIAPHAHRAGDLIELAYQFECDPDDQWAKDGFDLNWIENRALAAMDLAASRKPVDTGIDFADMIFLPVRNRWLRKEYGAVIVDEGQDMTVAQLELAYGVCEGRFCIVGDPNQAIYAFRGADSDSLRRLKAELQAEELTLTTTYRCGKIIVAEAQRLVPTYRAGDQNPDGEIQTIAPDALVPQAAAGDFILSRINAPLASTAMALIRARKRVRIAGKDIGKGLVDLIRLLAKGPAANSIPDFLERLSAWEEKQIARAVKARREERVPEIHDKVETLTVLTEDAVDLREVEARITALFSDDVGAGGYVTCSSVHKAKGLEADRVFVLRDTLYPKGNGRRKPKAARFAEVSAREERNIEYVAITRAKRTLVWVTSAAVAAPTPVDAPAQPDHVLAHGAVDASTLGWPAGIWPEYFTRDGIEYFRTTRELSDDDGLRAIIYEENVPGGRTITIIND